MYSAFPRKRGLNALKSAIMNKCISQKAQRTTDIDAWLAASKNWGHIVHFSVVLYNFITIKQWFQDWWWQTKSQLKMTLKSQQMFSSEERLKNSMTTMIQKKMGLTSSWNLLRRNPYLKFPVTHTLNRTSPQKRKLVMSFNWYGFQNIPITNAESLAACQNWVWCTKWHL